MRRELGRDSRFGSSRLVSSVWKLCPMSELHKNNWVPILSRLCPKVEPLLYLWEEGETYFWPHLLELEPLQVRVKGD